MKGPLLTAFIAIFLLASSAAGQKLEPPKLVPTPSTERQDQLINEGIELHDKGDYASAISRYEEVLRENPGNVLALNQRSTLAGVDDWLRKHQNKVANFLAWSRSYRWPKMD